VNSKEYTYIPKGVFDASKIAENGTKSDLLCPEIDLRGNDQKPFNG
jgi:hypothetical protein